MVFNALHGRFGEDGCIQGLLDILNLPYTHSGVLASALAMDKPMAKAVFAAAGIPVAGHKIVSKAEVLAGDVLPRPYVVKPHNEGSSVGVHICREGDNEGPLGHDDWPFGDTVMVEAFIPGRELTVAVIGRPAARRDRDHDQSGILRLRRQVCRRAAPGTSVRPICPNPWPTRRWTWR